MEEEELQQQQPEGENPTRSLPPGVRALLESSSSSSSDPFERRCAMNLARSYLPVPPPPAPARKITHTRKYRFHAPPSVILEKSKRFAKGALEHYNKRRKIKFELLDVMPVAMMPESGRLYTHVNFTARSSKEGSKEQLFFAELYNCGKRRAPGGFLVICCEPLGSDSTVGHKGFQVDGPSAVRKNVDFARCFACGPLTLHPGVASTLLGTATFHTFTPVHANKEGAIDVLFLSMHGSINWIIWAIIAV